MLNSSDSSGVAVGPSGLGEDTTVYLLMGCAAALVGFLLVYLAFFDGTTIL